MRVRKPGGNNPKPKDPRELLKLIEKEKFFTVAPLVDATKEKAQPEKK
jgi:hypothetical protein